MNKYQTGAVRDTGGKGRMDLLPMCALIRVSKHMEDAILPDPATGVPHYPERNWEKGLPIHTMIDSAFRHLAKYVDGWDDEDHLCAAATNLLMAMWMEEKRPEMQDIPTRSESAKYRSYGESTVAGIRAGIADALPKAEDTSSLASDSMGAFDPDYNPKDQRKPKKRRPESCVYYFRGGCMGTKERDACKIDEVTGGKCDDFKAATYEDIHDIIEGY